MANPYFFCSQFRRSSAIFVFGMKPWRKFLATWTNERNIIFVEKHVRTKDLLIQIGRSLFSNRLKFYVWGYKHPRMIEFLSRILRIPLVRLEDGFLRSVGLGSKDNPPMSICFDKKGLHFDPSSASELEMIIQTYDFKADVELLKRASMGMRHLNETGLSKYNTSSRFDKELGLNFRSKEKKRILVIGQVDEDMSIVKGCKIDIDSNSLVRLAAFENPGADIIYKPHPEIFYRTRSNRNSPDEVADIAVVLKEDIALANIFPHIDHVYTITSLAGFEALIRGISVTCIGAPFYSGWGLTDDRQVVERRKRKCSALELFAAAYLLYPKYYHPYTMSEISFEEAVDFIVKEKSGAS